MNILLEMASLKPTTRAATTHRTERISKHYKMHINNNEAGKHQPNNTIQLYQKTQLKYGPQQNMGKTIAGLRGHINWLSLEKDL